MLNRDRVIKSLESKKDRFRQYGEEQIKQRRQLQDQFETLRDQSAERILAALAASEVEWPGAFPTPEVDEADRFRLAFPESWADHRDARTWALATLYNRPVIAVDGSQLPPTKDFSIPVGAVQIGWYINDHTEGQGGYVKDLDFEVLSPDELEDDGEDGNAGMGFPNWRINQLRFVRECEKLCSLMAEYDQVPQEQKPLCFLDGSFIISFAGQLRPERAKTYVEAVQKLLACSETYQVPLVGFVDSTYSRDVVNMLGILADKPVAALSDARLFNNVLTAWGDRTPLFLCARADALSQPRGGADRSGSVAFYREVAFTYVRLTSDRPPSRVEMPRWIMDAGLAESVLDRVRAECVVGNGYPYAIETADAVAVITAQDRERFYAIFQQFAQREGMPLSIARKAVSKVQRR